MIVEFILTILLSFVAAFAGVAVAGYLVEKNKKRDQLLNEINHTNKAIDLTIDLFWSFCEEGINLKKHMSRLDDQEVVDWEFISTITTTAAPHPNELPFGLSVLHRLILNELTVIGRPNIVLMRLNALIFGYIEMFKKTEVEIRKSNSINENVYKYIIREMFSVLECIVYFSFLLYEYLRHHGKECRDKFRLSNSKEAPLINEYIITKKYKSEIPDGALFSSWFKDKFI